MIVLLLLLAPTLMAVAAVIERRVGPAAAGWFAALPIAFAVAVIAVHLDSGVQAAGIMALSAATHVAAQILFAIVGAAVLVRRGLVLGALAGAATYVLSSFVLAELSVPAAVIAAVLMLVAGPRLMPVVAMQMPTTRSGSTTVLLCLAAPLIVGAAAITSELAGPQLAGAIAAFPTMCLTLTVAVAHRGDRIAGVQALTGLVRSLPCYLIFCLVVAFAAPLSGLIAIPLGMIAGVACARLTWRGLNPAQRTTLVRCPGSHRRPPAGHLRHPRTRSPQSPAVPRHRRQQRRLRNRSTTLPDTPSASALLVAPVR